ncbi:ROK family protein [Streptomyces violascens]|uniref:Glucokinase n=1 Tax=Streptomyces violascens TaxID=67381 RepID=A0ABQ3R292_9ACTN|nr:ROK family protein [Streptomyces violascens]GGU32469.1 glucokinase [Streptomyces violascens]GHI43646.1 glucokinase [Streptomyces violascens]
MSTAITVFDVGGTHIRQAWWLREGELRARTSRPSPSFKRFPNATAAELQDMMVRELSDAVTETPEAVVGVSFGAALDHRTGIVYASAPLWGDHSEPFDLQAALSARRPDVTWHIVNDVTAALLHAAAAPGRMGHRKVLLATISSGIACRTIDQRHGQISVDGCGLQGEIGHLPAVAELAGRPVTLNCDCGEQGHLAACSSGPGIAQMAHVLQQREPERWANSLLAQLIADGVAFERAFRSALDEQDSLAIELLDAVTAPVAAVLRTALCLDPEIDETVLTGGVVHGLGQHYRHALMGHLTRQGLYLTSERTPEWLEQRVTVSSPGEADSLAGAGIAACTGASVAS